jgi:hypothetical protein
MSTRRVEILRFFCDRWDDNRTRCQQTATGEELPTGWTEVTRNVGPCGLTNYYTDETHHYCPEHKP